MKYDDFESFLVKRGIVKKLNDQNRFLKECNPIMICNNQHKIELLKDKVNRKRNVLRTVDCLYSVLKG